METWSIRSDQRVAVIGKTNSGKSYFTRYLLWNVPRLIVCDSKGTVQNAEWRLQTYTDRAYSRMVRDPRAAGRLRMPSRSGREWEETIRGFVKLRNVVIDVDELAQIGTAADEPLRMLFQVGRELGLGVVACMQRPSHIPLASLTEAEWYVVFQTRWPDDNDRIYDLIGRPGQDELERWGKRDYGDLEGHQFLIYSVEQDRAILYDSLDIQKRGA